MSLLRPVQPHESVWLSGYPHLDKLKPKFHPCGTPPSFECRPCVKSGASSTCHSDDSGIDGTVNLGPQSPLPGDTDDSEDSTSLDGYHMVNMNGTSTKHGRNHFRPLAARLYHDKPHAVDNVAESAQVSPSGSCCMAASRDNSYHQLHDSIESLKLDDNRFQILSYDQLLRLHEILIRAVPIRSRYASFPVIWTRLYDLFEAVRENLRESGVSFRDIRLNGGAASYVIGMERSPTYNDIDILISVDLSSDLSAIQKVKTAVLDALMRFLPEEEQVALSNSWSSHSELPPLYADRRFKYSPLSQIVIDSDKLLSDSNDNPSPGDRTTVSDGPSNTSPPEFESSMVPNPVCAELAVDPSPSCTDSASPVELVSPSSVHPCVVCNTSNERLHPLRNSLSSSLHTPSIQSLYSHPATPNGRMSLRESYIYKQFRKYGTPDADCWSLLSLGIPSTESKVIEFKFVDRMRRQFEFTVDSFQILLDPILSFIRSHPGTKMTRNFYPTVVAESVAGSFSLALHHLNNKLILTTEPEMIRGGGLLKYCRLLVNGYQAPNGIDVCSLERYMSSRFFIDFQDLESQRSKIEAFLANHFSHNEVNQKIQFLTTVYRVVSGSTICLMSYERYQTLNLICGMIQQLATHQQFEAHRTATLSLDWLTEQQNLVLDRIYLGTHLFPVISTAQPYRYACCQCDTSTVKSDCNGFDSYTSFLPANSLNKQSVVENYSRLSVDQCKDKS